MGVSGMKYKLTEHSTRLWEGASDISKSVIISMSSQPLNTNVFVAIGFLDSRGKS